MSDTANVLIVEDEQLVAADIRDLLEERGHKVLDIISRGSEVEERVKALQPNLILLDIVLQDQLDGIEIAERLRTQGDIPIIYLTAYADPKTLERAKRTRPAAYLTKPFDDREVGVMIDLVLQQAKARQQALDNLEAIFNAFPEPLLLVKPDGRIESVNTAFSSLTGLTKEKMELTPLSDVIYGIEPDNFPDFDEHEVSPHRIWKGEVDPKNSIQLLRLDKGWRKPASVLIKRLSLNGETRYMVEVRDIGQCLISEYDKDQAKIEVERQAARLRLLQETAMLLRETRDTDRLIEALLDRLPEAMKFDSVSGIRIHIGDRVFFSEKYISSPCRRFFHFETPDRSGGEIEVVYAQSVNDEAFVPSEADVVFRTIASLLAAHLRQEPGRDVLSATPRADAEKVEALERLAGGVAHDFSNLLTVIGGYCELLTDSLHGQKELSEKVSHIQAATSRATQLSRQLLAYVRRHPARLQRIDLNEVVEGSLDVLRDLLGTEADLQFYPFQDIFPVEADATHLRQVLANLVANARSSCVPGKDCSILISTLIFPRAVGRPPFPGARPIDYAALSITDHGAGIPDDIQPKIFDPYFTTRDAGGGLGLPICAGLVRQMGGEIVCSSQVGLGSTFTVFLPRASGPMPPCAPKSKRRPRKPTSTGTSEAPTVLVVEGDEVVRGLMSEGLQQAGCSVLSANNGRHARGLLDDMAPDAVQFVLTDLVLAEEGGLRLVEWLRQNRPAIRVIFSSSFGRDPEVARKIARYGQVIEKPFTPSELGIRFSEMIRKK